MYIKSITISGFKSYKKKVHLNLHRGHNVIVGSNGSGKSNIYAALEFVLSSKYDMIRSEQRKQLLHDAGQSGVVSASVEIVFDNTDKRFPINEDKISIKRTIGAKKDEYFVQNTHTTKAELNNLLESAGISKYNQHFIVPQGQIAQRVKERDNERLQLIKEIAGTRIYDKNRNESKKLMSDADNKREKVKSIIDYFQDRLDELKEEKEELAKFETLDRQRRSVQYQIYDKERMETQNELERIQESEGKTDEKNEELHEELKQIRDDIDTQKKERDELTENLEKIGKALKKKQKDLRVVQRVIVGLENKQKSLEHDNQLYHGKKEKYDKQLNELNDRITATKEDLTKITQQFETMKRKEVNLRNKLTENDTLIKDLYAKQERLGQYRSKTERNKDLTQQINGYKTEIAAQERLCADITKDNESIDAKIEEYAKELKKTEKLVSSTEKKFNSNEKNKDKLKRQRNKLQNDRKILWKNKNDFDKLRDELSLKRGQNEKDFRFTMHLNMYRSYMALKRIQRDIEQYGDESRYKLSGRFYGAVIENFRVVDAKYNIAVEAAASNKLFYYLVENDQVATELIKIMQREHINRVTFIPLKRCGPARQKERTYPQGSADVIPIMSLIEYDETVDNLRGALLQIFGNTLIPQNIDIGFDYATRENYQCVTLNGDIVTSGGAMDGGFNENKYRRLKYYTLIREIDERHKEMEERLTENEDNLKQTENKLLEIDNKIRRNGQEMNQYRDDLANSKEKLLEIEEEIDIEEKSKSTKLKSLEKHEVIINRIQSQIEALELEMKQPLKRKLSDEEEEKLQDLIKENEDITKNIRDSLEEVNEVETQMINIQSLLKDNLNPQQKDLISKIKKCNESYDNEQQIDSLKNKLQITTEKRDKLKEDIAENEKNIDSWNSRIKTLESDLSKLSEDEQELMLTIEEHSISSEKLVGKQQALQERLEQLIKYIRELGALSASQMNKYKRKSIDSLNKTLKKVQKDLEKYKNVNKKALDQYNSFSKEKAKLNKRNQDQLTDKDHIEQLMEHLDTKKDDAIQRTFNAINIRFKEAFKLLVSRGDAKLMLFRRTENNNNNHNNRSQDDEEDIEMNDEYTQSQTQSSQRRGGRQRRRRRSSNMRVQRNRRKSSMMSQGQYSFEDELDDRKYAGVGIRVAFGKDSQIDEEEEEDEEKESERARDMRQLSGGQQTVVALALIFAIQQCDPSPFYVFDEIDAALDQQYRKAVADIIESRKEDTQFITTTFRPEILHVADKCFVVDFKAKISTVSEKDPNEVDITKYT